MVFEKKSSACKGCRSYRQLTIYKKDGLDSVNISKTNWDLSHLKNQKEEKNYKNKSELPGL